MWEQTYLYVAIACLAFLVLQVLFRRTESRVEDAASGTYVNRYPGYEPRSGRGALWLGLLNAFAAIAGLLSFAMQIAQWRGWL